MSKNIKLRLQQDYQDGARLVTNDMWMIIQFKKDGTIYRFQGIDTDVGLQVDNYRRIIIDDNE